MLVDVRRSIERVIKLSKNDISANTLGSATVIWQLLVPK